MCTCVGITNGIDANEWSPSSDEHIASQYSVNDLSGKVGSILISETFLFHLQMFLLLMIQRRFND